MNLLSLIRTLVIAGLVCATAPTLHAASSSSANYSIVADSTDGGGTTISSANYTSQASFGGVAGLASVASPAETVKSGYVGQLYQITGLVLSPAFIADGTTQQLNATQTLDDGTVLSLAGTPAESWSVVGGQIPAGLVLDPDTGIVSGTPLMSGTYSFTVLVTDALGNSSQQTFSGMSFPPTDTPTMPPWALLLLAASLCGMAGIFLAKSAKPSGHPLASS
jgi:hypothetical protein